MYLDGIIGENIKKRWIMSLMFNKCDQHSPACCLPVAPRYCAPTETKYRAAGGLLSTPSPAACTLHGLKQRQRCYKHQRFGTYCGGHWHITTERWNRTARTRDLLRSQKTTFRLKVNLATFKREAVRIWHEGMCHRDDFSRVGSEITPRRGAKLETLTGSINISVIYTAWNASFHCIRIISSDQASPPLINSVL